MKKYLFYNFIIWFLLTCPNIFGQVGDDCSNAINLANETSPFSGTTIGFNHNFDDSCLGDALDRIFFIDVSVGQTISIGQSSNGYDSRNRVAFGDTCPGQNEIDCWDDPDSQIVTWTNPTGTTQRVWWVQDAFNPSGAGTFTLSWNIFSPPANDICNNAIPITCNQTITGSTLNANLDVVSFCGTSLNATFGIWYELVGTGSTISLEMCNSNYDTQLGVFSGNCDNLVCVAGDDDGSACGTASFVEFNSLLDTTYFIFVSGYNSNRGDFELEIDCNTIFVNDLTIVDFLNPVNSCSFQGAQQVQVEIRNEGTLPQSNFSIGYILNGTETNSVFNGTIQPDASALFTFPQFENLDAQGNYEFQVFTNISGDQNPLNDTLTQVVEHLSPFSVNLNLNADAIDGVCTDELVQVVADFNFTFQYQWSTGSTNYFINDYPTQTTTYFVTITDTQNPGCETVENITVDILSNPIEPVAFASSNTLCPGGEVVLTVQNVTGNLIWNTGETGQSISVTQSGFYRVTLVNDIGCSTTSQWVFISQEATPVINNFGDGIICGQETETLQVNFGDSFLWSTGETTQSISVIPSVTTLYTVTVTTTNNCIHVLENEITVASDGAPSAVTNMLPLDGSQNVALPVQFSWSPSINTTNYNIFIWEEGNVPNSFPSFSTTQINYSYSGFLQYGQTYNWRVCSENVCSNLETICGTTQKFTLNFLPNLEANIDNTSFADTVFSGTEIEIAWDVLNNGVGSTQGVSSNALWYDVCYLSTDQILSSDDISLGWKLNPSALSSGGGYNSSLTFTLPNGITGDYYVIVCTDRYNNMPESDESDNCDIEVSTIFIQLSPYPDLVVNSFPPPSGAAGGIVLPNTNYDIQWTVENQSSGTNSSTTLTGEWYDRIYFSFDNVFNPQTAFLQQTILHQGDLLVGESYTANTSFLIPSYATDTVYIYVCTDALNTEYEYVFENNNCLRSIPLVVPDGGRPDFALLSSNTPDTVSNKENITLTWVGENDGADFEGSLNHRIYISDQPDFSGNYSVLASDFQFQNLPNNTNYAAQKNIQIPSDLTGKYYVLLQANYNQAINESDYDNNFWVDSLIILSPNLIVSEISTLPNALSGQTITFEWKITNIGEGDLLGYNVNDRVTLVDVNSSANTLLATSLNGNTTIFSGDTLIRQKTYSIPNGLTGSYCIEVETNSFQSAYENELYSDNTLINCNTFLIEAADYPNLVANSISNISPSATAGETVEVEFTVGNFGNTFTNGIWSDRVYLSSNSTWIPNAAILLKTETQSQVIAVGDNYTKTTSVQLPYFLSGGDYYFHLVTDSGNNIFETSENDNVITSIAPIAIAIYPEVDLQFVGVPAGPATLTPGQSTTVTYEARNNGTVATPVDVWVDGLYLSPNPTWEPSDILIAQWQRTGTLGANETYIRQESFTLPAGFTNAFYLCLVLDHENAINETNENNNFVKILQQNGDTITIVYPPQSDLVVDTLQVPSSGIAGQPINLNYTIQNIANNGDATGEWTESFYLSSDPNLNSGDILLGQKNHVGGLLSNASYNDSIEVTLPLGISGNYFILIKTDGNNNLSEENENNNIKSQYLFITQPAPGDLFVVADEIIIPPVDTIATDFSVSWKLKNIGQNPIFGYMAQGVYLSEDKIWDASDILLGTWTGTVGLDPNSAVNHSLTARLENVNRQNYYVFVKTDLLDHFLEEEETNNCSVTPSTVFIEIPELPIGFPTTPTIMELEQPIYYRIEIPTDTIGETMEVSLTSQDSTAFNELYIRRNKIPSRTIHDFSFGTPFTENQSIIIPSLDSGTYYVMGYTVDGIPIQNVELLAEIIPFQIISINTNKGGNTGTVTALLEGAKFENGMMVSLEKEGQAPIIANQVSVINSTQAYITFPLDGAELGFYDVIASTMSDQDTLVDSFEIITGTIGNSILTAGCSIDIGGQNIELDNISDNVDILLFEPSHPAVVRPNQIVPITLRFENNGDIDVPVPSRIFSSISGFPLATLTDNLGENFQELPLIFTEDNGPPNVLRPGGVAFITVYSKATESQGELKFQLLSN